MFSIENTSPGYALFSVGGETRVKHQFSRTWSGAGGFEFSRNEFSNVDPDLIGTGIADDNTLFIQFVELKWDTSDSLLNPTRGMVLRGELDHSTTALVSTTSFVKLLLEARHYYPFTERVILATRFSIGGIEPYAGSETVPGNVRFLAGDLAASAAMRQIESARWTARIGRLAVTACWWEALSYASPSPAISAGSYSSTLAMSTVVALVIISAIFASG